MTSASTVRTTNSYRNNMSYKFILTAVVALVASLALAVGAQAAEFGLSSFDVSASTTQAGGHPDVSTSMTFNTEDNPQGEIDYSTTPASPLQTPVEPVKDVKVSLPEGLVGDVTGVPRCSAAMFANSSMSPYTPCPDDTQVGVATLDIDLGLFGKHVPMSFGVYNLQPSSDAAAEFGFTVLTTHVNVTFKVRASDGGLDTVINGINEAARLYGQTLTLWGVPSDPSHDNWRGDCLTPNTGSPDPINHPFDWQPADHPGARPCRVTTPRVPLLRNPTSCGAKLENTVVAASWVHQDRWASAETKSDAVTGCGDVPFRPSVSVAPTSGSADAPTGLDVTVGVEQNRDADGLSAADVKRTVVTLPEGYTISPSAADGLKACDDAHVGVGADGPADCPDASKVGSASIVSPILDTPLTGPIYLGPSTSPGHYKVYVVVEGQGVRLKLPGDISADAATGRLTTTFDNTPQQPFTTFKLHFDAGDRAVLASPATCGTNDATATVTPWSSPAGRDVALTTPVALGGGVCANGNPFAPKLVAGVSNAQAGSSNTTFALAVARDDRTQTLGAISNVVLPPGLTAKVGSVPRCDSARAGAGTCGAESKVGTVDVTAGPGGDPLHLTGTAYLTEGYKGAPYGLSLVVPALAGPYDLGTVVIRSAISVGPDARISVQTDPLPQILAGIPLRLHAVTLRLDRAGFMVNPTSCAGAAVTATLAGSGGERIDAVSRFGLNGCRALPFTPRMTASAAKSTRAAGAGLHVGITQAAGQANLKTVAVSLPAGLGIKLKALGTACSQAQLDARNCPAASKVGGASAVTPLLNVPLKGAVYLVQGGGRLPKLVALLQGGGLTIPLTGSTSLSRGGRIGTTFNAIPDVPISAFDLDLPHSKRQILETASSWPACGAAGSVAFTGQNGARLTRTLAVRTRCTSSKRTTKKATKRSSRKM
jgi:hypothetical protein